MRPMSILVAIQAIAAPLAVRAQTRGYHGCPPVPPLVAR